MENTYHLIDDYLSGQLVGIKLDSFKAELKTNTKLQEQVALQQALISEIEATRKAELKAYLAANISKGGLTFMPNLASALGAAAMVSLLVAAYFIFDLIVDKRANNVALESAPKVLEIDTNPEKSHVFFDSIANDSQTLAIADIPKSLQETQPPIVAEEVSESDNVTEDTEKYELEEKDNVSAEKGKAAPASNDAFDVKADVKLSSKQYKIAQILTDEASEFVETAANKPKKNTTRDDSNAAEAEETKEKSSTTSRNIDVEFWQSVVNFKGYSFDGKTIKLYSVPSSKKLEFKELDNRIYLKLDGKNYYIEKNNKYNRLIELTNPTLLNILND